MTATTPRFPFGEFVTVLEFCFKDVDRAAPDTSRLQRVAVMLDAGEELGWGHAAVDGFCVVPEVDSVVDGERPERVVDGIWPVQGSMQQHGASPKEDGLDSALGFPILVVGADAAEVELLAKSAALSLEFRLFEDAIVAMIPLDGAICESSVLFKLSFGNKRVGNSKA